MKLKTYVAGDLQEALAQVKKELGPEAVILSTQTRRLAPSESSWGRRLGVEVTAAVDPGALTDAGHVLPFPPLEALKWGPAFSHLKEDLEEVKALFRQWLGEQGPPAWLAPHRDLAAFYKALLRVGVNQGVIRRWLAAAHNLLKGTAEVRGSLKEKALRLLMQFVNIVDPWKTPSSGPRRWTILGPTGVGKTTMVAKLAVQAAFMKKMQVGLVSLDNVRLGGQDQLAAYARITGLPLAVVLDGGELAAALEKMAALDLVLVDTPGRNPRAPELARDLHQSLGQVPGVEHHLVLSATTKECDLADALQGFGILPLSSLMVTKVDESREFAGIFNLLGTHPVPVSFLSAGQRVPEDLEPASRRRLAGLLFDTKNSQPSLQ